jgi:hypothetical protein
VEIRSIDAWSCQTEILSKCSPVLAAGLDWAVFRDAASCHICYASRPKPGVPLSTDVSVARNASVQAMASSEQQVGWFGHLGRGGSDFRRGPVTDITRMRSPK